MPTAETNGSNSYQVRRVPRFDRSYDALIKKHYRRNKKAKQEFEQIVKDFIKEVEDISCLDRISDLEPFPSKTAEAGFEFRKKRWRRLPGLEGSARFCRLIFLVCHPKKRLYLIWIYTHAEFSEPNSRPPDKDLRDEISFIKQEKLNEAEGESFNSS